MLDIYNGFVDPTVDFCVREVCRRSGEVREADGVGIDGRRLQTGAIECCGPRESPLDDRILAVSAYSQTHLSARLHGYMTVGHRIG